MTPRSIGERLLRRLLKLSVPADRRSEVLGDLDERYTHRAELEGSAPPRRWLRRQVVALILWAWGERIRRIVDSAGGDDMGEWLRGSAGDVRHALRGLLANPGYATVAVVTLALGIGGNTAVFSVVDGVLFRPLPFPAPDKLVAIHETRVGQSWWSAAPSNAQAWRERSRTLSDVAWAQAQPASLLDAERNPEPIQAVRSSWNLFDLLQVEPALGRSFEPGDDEAGADDKVILTHDTWSQRFGADPGILGRRLTVDGVPRTVVGVLSPGQEPSFFGAHDLIIPRPVTEAEINTRGRILQAVGRIRDDAAIESAREEMASLASVLDNEAPGAARGWGVRLVPLKDQMVGSTRTGLLVLLGAVGFVLLVACANLSNVMLARGSARTGDLAVRASLGAGRARLVRHLLAESVVIATLGGVAGVALAGIGTRTLLRIDPTILPRLDQVGVDGRLLAFVAAVSLLAAGLFGLAPAVRATRLDLAPMLRGSGRGGGRTSTDHRLRNGLIASEVALVVVLLVGASVMVREVQALGTVDPGFETEARVAVRLTLPTTRYPDSASMARFVVDLTEQARALPGVVAAGTVTTLPLSGGPGYTSFHVPRSLPEPPPGEEPLGGMEVVGPGYFEAMGIPVLAGRTYREEDITDGRPMVVIDEGVVRNLERGIDPLTDALRIAPPSAGASAAWKEVIGVVGSVRYGLATDARPRIYLPEGHVGFNLTPRTLVVRTRPGSGESVVSAIRDVVREVDPLLPIQRIEWLDGLAHSSISRSRFQGVLLAVFATLALALGAVGVYGVVSYSVSRRAREMGLRLALGARRGQVLATVVRSAMVPVFIGLGMGTVGALVLGRALGAMVPRIEPLDPVSFVLAAAALLIVAGVSAVMPGLRATRIDPALALRED